MALGAMHALRRCVPYEGKMTIQQITKGELSVAQSAAHFTGGPVERMAGGSFIDMCITC